MATTWILLALVTVAQQQRPGAPDPPEVRTSATVTRTVQPDLATIMIQVAAEGVSPRDAERRLALLIDGIRGALAGVGIPRDSVVNRSRYYWWSGRIETVLQPVRYVQVQTATTLSSKPVQDTAYRAHDALQVRVRDLRRIGLVIDTLVGRGVTNISGVQFSAVNTAAAEQAALRQATVQARREAEAIAEAAGMALGPVILLSTAPEYRYGYDDGLQLRGVVALGSGSGSTEIMTTAIPVSVTVYARWALVRRP